MKTKLIALIVLLSWSYVIYAQQGTVVIKDSTTNTQGSVKAAGTVTPNVLGVQGNASGVPLPVTISSGGATSDVNVKQVGGQTAATNGNGVLAVAGAASSGLPVTIIAGSSSTLYSSPVAGSAITVGTTTVAMFGTTTTQVQSIHINNATAAAITITITDGNNVPYIGSTTLGPGYSIPASSNLDLNMGPVGHIFTSGVRMVSSVAAGVIAWIEGKQ